MKHPSYNQQPKDPRGPLANEAMDRRQKICTARERIARLKPLIAADQRSARLNGAPLGCAEESRLRQMDEAHRTIEVSLAWLQANGMTEDD